MTEPAPAWVEPDHRHYTGPKVCNCARCNYEIQTTFVKGVRTSPAPYRTRKGRPLCRSCQCSAEELPPPNTTACEARHDVRRRGSAFHKDEDNPWIEGTIKAKEEAVSAEP